MSLILLGLSFGGPWITAVGLKEIAADTGGARQVPSLAVSLALFGSARRRPADGPARQQLRHPLDRHLRLGDDRDRPVHVVVRRAVAALRRPRPVHGPARQRRTERAAVRLCQPLVRPPPRLGAGADFERRLSRRLRLADHLRALDRVFRLALDHDRLRGLPARRSSCRWRSSSSARRRSFLPRPRHATPGSARPKVFGWNPNVVFGMLALAGFLCCVTMSMPQQHLVAYLQRPRHLGDARRHHAVGAARHGLLQPPGLGLAVGPDGRPAHRASQLDPAMRGDERISVHPGRRRPVRGRDRVRHRLQRADPGLCADHPRPLSDERGALAGADAAAVQRQRHGDRRLARRLSLRHLRLLHAGVRHRRRLQRRQHRDPVHAAGAPAHLS